MTNAQRPRSPRFVLLAALGASFALPATAHAVNWDLRLDPAIAGHFDSTQPRNFSRAGGGATLRPALEVLSFLDVHLSLGVHAWPTNRGTTQGDDYRVWNAGAGLRLKGPWKDHTISPWLDIDLNYMNAGGDHRFGYSVGLGLAVALDDAKCFRLGPYLRYMQVINPDGSSDAIDPKIFMGGISFEVGSKVAKAAPPPEPVAIPESDTDHDGVKDADDQCPTVAGPAANHGCPVVELDRDHDGIVDASDKCPDLAEDKDGFEDEDGCPELDNDKDGVVDTADSCPNVAGTAKTLGCPDQDGDGIADADDQCPAVAGPADNHGCPVHKSVKVTETKLELTQKVFFGNNSTKILPKSFPLLDEIAAVLKEHEKFRVSVEGHTDSNGNAEKNKTLSRGRAESVRTYLVGKGVAADRMEAQGFGAEKPVDDNKTPKGRENNRRVEFLVLPTAQK